MEPNWNEIPVVAAEEMAMDEIIVVSGSLCDRCLGRGQDNGGTCPPCKGTGRLHGIGQN